MKRQICAAVLTLTLALPVGLVFAESAQPDQKQPESCKEDAKKFCSNVTGTGEIIKCLKGHETELTKACKADLEQWAQEQLKKQILKY